MGCLLCCFKSKNVDQDDLEKALLQDDSQDENALANLNNQNTKQIYITGEDL